MAIDRGTAAQRPLQGPHSNHHPASAVPDRDVKSGPDVVAAGTNPIAKTDMADGTEQPPTERDTSVQLTSMADGTPQA